MNYISPDYEKVALSTADIFAAYTGCPENERSYWAYTRPCAGTANYQEVYETFTSAGMVNECYTTLNP